MTGLHTEIAKYMSTLMPSRMRCYGRVIIARITPKNRGAIMNDKLKSAVYGLVVGDELITRFADGEVRSKVLKK